MLKINTFTFDLDGDYLLSEHTNYSYEKIDTYVERHKKYPNTLLIDKTASSAVLKQRNEDGNFYDIIVVSQLTDSRICE